MIKTPGGPWQGVCEGWRGGLGPRGGASGQLGRENERFVQPRPSFARGICPAPFLGLSVGSAAGSQRLGSQRRLKFRKIIFGSCRLVASYIGGIRRYEEHSATSSAGQLGSHWSRVSRLLSIRLIDYNRHTNLCKVTCHLKITSEG